MTERNKVVIRHLPPDLPEEIFWKSLSTWIEPIDQTTPAKCLITYKSFIPGKLRQNKGKVNLPSRAYLYFLTIEDLIKFHQSYSQQVFRDSKGNITLPKIEFAPFQKIPTQAKKVDSRSGTIDSSQEYHLFLKKLESSSNQETEEEEINSTEDSIKSEVPKITPLIQHLRSLKKSAQEVTTTQKLQSRNPTSSGSKVSFNKDQHDLPPHQIIKRGITNSSVPLNATTSSSSNKQTKSKGLPSSSKPTKGNPNTSNTSKPIGTSSVLKLDSVELKPQVGPSKSKRGKKALDQSSQSKSTTDTTSTSNNPNPIPIKIIPRPKEILTKPNESEKSIQINQNLKKSNQINSIQTHSNISSEVKFNQKKVSSKTPSSSSRSNPSSKRNPQSISTETNPVNETKNTTTNPTVSTSGSTRGRGTEESAGARRRLGMALAGISGINERKTSTKETPK